MCGIAMLLGGSELEQHLESLLRAQAHRGPDGHGAELIQLRSGSELGLGHRRLAIIDLTSGGHQPMRLAGRQLWISYNGEIYNYVELREQLEALGHSFRSRSDTEVVLRAYAEWGSACQTRFVGMWAFIIIDPERERLFASRDPFGIKPLYYTRWGDQGWAIASEMKDLLRLPGVGRRAHPQSVFGYLRFDWINADPETLIDGILRLPPASQLKLELDTMSSQPRVQRYWQIDLSRTHEISFEDAAKELRELFFRSVSLHLRGDVPIGTCLSGGIDSSSITCVARELLGPSAELHAFSYLPDDPALSEAKWIDLVVKRAGVTLHKVSATPALLIEHLDELILSLDEPFGSTSVFAQRQVFRAIHNAGIKVVLDGQGADELLGGYRSCLPARIAALVSDGRPISALLRAWKFGGLPGVSSLRVGLEALRFLLPIRVQQRLRPLVGKGLYPRWLRQSWFEDRDCCPALPFGRHEDAPFRGFLLDALELHSVPKLLRYEDRNSMAFSVESRVPFLTIELAEFLFSLPDDYLLGPDGTTKSVFRAAMRGIVPDPILDRRDKIGFATPERDWLVAQNPWVVGMLTDPASAARVPALDLAACADDWGGIRAGTSPFDFRVWRWLNLIRWAELYDISFD